MNVFLDIETIPGQGLYDEFLQEARDNFKAPSDLTKAKACADLGLTGDKARYTSKDDAIAMWVERFAEEKAPEVAEHNWRRTALDGSKGEVISACFAVGESEVFSHYRTLDMDEGSMIRVLFNSIWRELASRPALFIGHSIAFDLKFLYQRAVILDVNPVIKLPFNGRHEQHYFDNMQAWAGYGNRISQDSLCKALGIEGKPDGIDGSLVWDHVRDGMIDKVVEYNIDDVEKARMIYNRLTFK